MARETFDPIDQELRDWEAASHRAKIVENIVRQPRPLRPHVERAAKENSVSEAMIYRWIAAYSKCPEVKTLLPKRRGPKLGHVGIRPEMEDAIEEAIREVYTKHPKVKFSKLNEAVLAICRKKGLSPCPSRTTIRRRAAQIDQELKNKLKHGPKKGKHLSTPIKKPYTADHPMQVVQFDHTLCDVFIVDEFDRSSLMRPWLTLAIDVYSRCIVGYYLALDPPSAVSVAMAVVNTVLPKDDTLSRLHIDNDLKWPCHGKYVSSHHDNAREFRSKALQLGCTQNDINLIFRPPGKPHFGGHIERLMGTIMGEVHLLPGTTFSNTQERGEYNSEEKSTLSFADFEKWLVLQIIIYNNRIHRAISSSPQSRFLLHERSSEILQNTPINSFSFFVSFLPYEARTIRKEGIEIFKTFYRSDVLYSPKTPIGSKIIVRYDPRDISKLYYVSPEGQIYTIPLAHAGHPKISLHEHKAAIRALKKRGMGTIDKDTIYRAIEEQRDLLKKATKTTNKMRNLAAKLGIRQDQLARHIPDKKNGPNPEKELPSETTSNQSEPISMFDIEEW